MTRTKLNKKFQVSCSYTEKLFYNIFDLFLVYFIGKTGYCVYFRVRTRKDRAEIYLPVN